MTEQQDALAAGVAASAALIDPYPATASEPFGYGHDYKCITALTPRLEVSDELIALGECLLRAISCERGQLPHVPGDEESAEWGTDVLGMINRGQTRATIREIEGTIRNEWRKDDRVADVQVTARVSGDGREIDVTGRVTPEDPQLQPFTLIGALTADGAILTEITGSAT